MAWCFLSATSLRELTFETVGNGRAFYEGTIRVFTFCAFFCWCLYGRRLGEISRHQGRSVPDSR